MSLKGFIGKLFAPGKGGQKREAVVCNYSQANSLAVIFKLENEDQYQTVRQYLKFVKDEHQVKNVKGLVFVDEKETPPFIQSRIDSEFFTRKDVNWQQIPSGVTVDNFCEEPYDIIIDLTFGDCPPLVNVLNASKAKFRVGRSQESKQELYDLMIDMGSKQGLKEFIEQVNHYLTLINR